MGLNTNGVDQRWSITGALFNSTKVYTVAVVVKVDNTTSASQFMFGGFGSGGVTRFSGAVYRADQSPKYIAKVKSSSTSYVPSSGTAAFTPSGTDWNIFIFSRSVTGSASGASRQMLNSGTISTANTEENGNTDLSLFGGGAYRNSGGTYQNWFKGKTFCVATWDRVLSSTEEDELKAWVNPMDVSGGAPNAYVEFAGSGVASGFVSPTGNTIAFTGSPTLDNDTPYSTPTVASVNSGAGITAGSTGNTAQLTSFVSAPTSGTFGGKAISITNYNSGTGVLTFDFAAYSDGVSYPNPLNAHTLIVTNGAETAELAGVQLNLPADHDSVITSGLVTGNDKYLPYWDAGLVNGDYYIFPMETVPVELDPSQPTNFEVYADGGVRAATTGDRTIWRYDISASNFVRVDVTVSDSGSITATGGLTSSGQTSRALTASGLTHRGL